MTDRFAPGRSTTVSAKKAKNFTAAASTAAFLLLAALRPAAADDAVATAVQSLLTSPAASIVSDDELAGIRGRYVPPATAQLAISAATVPVVAPNSVAVSAVVSQPADAAQNSLGGLVPNGVSGGIGQVLYFGVEMVSQWQTGSGADASSASVGASVGINLQNGATSQGTWSQSQGNGLSAAPPASDSINGEPPLTNMSNGIGQNIQVAGNANSVGNQADVAITTGVPVGVIVPAVNTCGSPCSASITPSGMSVGISLPGGVVTQTINPNGILQSARILGDANQIMNTMHVQVQVAPAAALNAGQITTLLQTAQTLLH